MNTTENPWQNMPTKPPYVLKVDCDGVKSFNNGVDDNCKLHTERLPEPFIGKREAPVVLLNINPKYIQEDKTNQTTGDFAKLCRANWNHETAQTAKFPFYYLDPRLKGHRGSRWWNKKLRDLIKKVGETTLAQQIFAIEFCAYPSEKCYQWPELAGDKYRNHLVELAIKQDATIIIMQGATRWHEAIPKLKSHKKTFELRNPQNSSIKAANLCRPADEKDFETITKVLSGK
jgi:hypothetical protein